MSVGFGDQVPGPPSSGFMQSLAMNGALAISEQPSDVVVAETRYLQQPLAPALGQGPIENVPIIWPAHAALAWSTTA
jgi:hypothetical protein